MHFWSWSARGTIAASIVCARGGKSTRCKTPLNARCGYSSAFKKRLVGLMWIPGGEPWFTEVAIGLIRSLRFLTSITAC